MYLCNDYKEKDLQITSLKWSNYQDILLPFLVTVYKTQWQKQFRGERVYCWSQFQVTVHHCGEVKATGTWNSRAHPPWKAERMKTCGTQQLSPLSLYSPGLKSGNVAAHDRLGLPMTNNVIKTIPLRASLSTQFHLRLSSQMIPDCLVDSLNTTQGEQ